MFKLQHFIGYMKLSYDAILQSNERFGTTCHQPLLTKRVIFYSVTWHIFCKNNLFRTIIVIQGE